MPLHWLDFCDFEIGAENMINYYGATGAKLDTEPCLINARITVKDPNGDIPLLLSNVVVTRQKSSYMILGTPDLRKR